MKTIISRLSLIFTFSFLFAALSYSQVRLKPSGNIITKDFTVSAFNGIHVSSDFTALLTIADEMKVTIETDDNLLKYVKVSVDRNILLVKQVGNLWVSGKETLVAHISVPSLDYIKASDDAIVILKNKLVANELKVDLNEDSTLDGEIAVNSLDVKLDEDSYMTVSGKADRLSAVLNEDSEMRNIDFQVGDLDVNLDEDSIMKITVNGKLNAKLNGDSEMVYKGNPTSVNQIIRGDSEMERIRG